MPGLTGGCLCGAVRFRLDAEPFDCGWCHCRTCQLWGGAPAMAFATVPATALAWTAGSEQVKRVKSSSFGRRGFCAQCGTPLLIEVDHQPDTIDFPIGALDNPDACAPGFHIFWASKVAWFNPGDALPRHDRFRPDTRGLPGTEPPGE